MTTSPLFDNKQVFKMARAACEQANKELDAMPRHMLNEGNPNHPMYDTIFGYDREEFMARQYR